MDASLAATGIFEVFAISTVRSVRGLSVRGSIRPENSSSTCVISFPRSPQPMYMIISASHHFASWCCVMVFPVPKPPGIAAVPPFAMGSMVSIIRCPVIRGRLLGSLSAKGRGVFMGHFWQRVSSCSLPSSPSMTHTTSFMVYLPLGAVLFTVPEREGGMRHLCSMTPVSGQEAYIMPPCTLSPAFTLTVTSHLRFASSCSMDAPSYMKAPICSAMLFRGRSMPSNMLDIMPGPKVTDTGAPVPFTGSPGYIPPVGSYTCMVVSLSVTPMTSPTSPLLPT